LEILININAYNVIKLLVKNAQLFMDALNAFKDINKLDNLKEQIYITVRAMSLNIRFYQLFLV
jgi:hypothetical protein